jgi:ABC-type transport system involved in multi-copper enzyme maturation permease subunit
VNAVAQLVAKDLHFHRAPIAFYTGVGFAAVWLLARPHEAAFFAGSVLLITVLISVGIHLVMSTVVYERRDQTLAFVMTLPITARDYTLAKVLGNLGIFTISWGLLAVGLLGTILWVDAIPDGLVPYVVTILAQLFTGYLLTLSTAIVSESVNATIAAIVIANLLVQAVMFAVPRFSGVQGDFKQQEVLWRPSIALLLGIEAAAAIALVTFTFWAQGRKREFV